MGVTRTERIVRAEAPLDVPLRPGICYTERAMTLTLADLLAPVTPEQFFAEYHDRKPLHVRGGLAKFAQVLSWRQINRLLDMTHIWSGHSLQLVMDGTPVPPEQYCGRATSRDNAHVLQPEAAKVREAYADRDNAALRAENDALKHQLEEKRDEPVPTSYDGNSHALAGWLRRKNNTADR